MTDRPDTHLSAPRIERIRHDLRRRELTVADAMRLTPSMIRLTLTGQELGGFASAGFDDHLKLFVPAGEEVAMRDYTPRHYDPVLRQLIVDVVDHPGGPAADWARTAKAGDSVTIGGPRGSKVITGDITHWLLIGDESALPAIGRQIEELGPDMRVTAIVAVPSAQDEQTFEARADLAIIWVHRPAHLAHDPLPLMDAVNAADISAGTFAWIAAEATVARAMRDRLVERGLPREWTAAAGYWLHGSADSAEKAI